MRLKFDVKGIEKVKYRLGSQAADDLESAIEIDLAVETRKTAGNAADNSPVDTGALQASLRSSTTREDTMTYYWGTRLPYGLRQEYEHEPRKGWMRLAYHSGNRRTLKVLKTTIKKRLGG